MSDELRRAAEEVVDGLCRRHGGEEGEGQSFSPELWSALAEADLVLAALAPEHGGAGAGLGTELAAIRVAARACAPLPLAETGLAGWLLSRSGREAPRGPLTVALAGPDLELAERDGGWTAAGSLPRVPWAREAELVVVLDALGEGSRLVLLGGELMLAAGTNLAGEPRDRVRFDTRLDADRVLASDVSAGELTRRGALARTAALAGAAEAVLALSTEYVGQRRQFGRPLVRFQAVQQRLAIMVGEVRAMRTAAEAAGAAAEEERGEEVAIAAAKAFASAAAGSVAAAAHQLHGAIGFTEEHRLHRATSRLWSWREEFGDERRWSERLGELALAASAPEPWALLSGAVAR